LSEVEFDDFPEPAAPPPAPAAEEDSLPGLDAITGAPDMSIAPPSDPGEPANDLPPLNAITGGPDETATEALSGLPPLPDEAPDLPELPASAPDLPPLPQSSSTARIPNGSDAGLPPLPDDGPPSLPEDDALPELPSLPEDDALPPLPEEDSLPDSGPPAIPESDDLPDLPELPPLDSEPEPMPGLPPLPNGSPEPLDDMPLPDIDMLNAPEPVPAPAPEPEPQAQAESEETQVASLPPEPDLPAPNAPDKLVIEFAETENDIPYEMKEPLNALASRLKSENKGVVVRPFVGGGSDAQMANVISTRRAFNVRTYLIDKGVPHFAITIDRNQPTDAGGPERVELLVK
tara:strand:+ start:292 stop:1329 length:1038 start_codon:yes stop_codon:yes gene_type:complete